MCRLLLFLCLRLFCCSALMLPVPAPAQTQQALLHKEEVLCKKIQEAWLNEALHLTKHCVGFSAPVAARALCYVGIGMYEVQVEHMPGYRSLSGQLAEYNRTVWAENNTSLYWPAVVNNFLKQLITALYANMPPSQRLRIQNRYDTLKRLYQRRYTAAQLQAAAGYGAALAKAILNWSADDKGHEGYNNNYPASYQRPVGPAFWSPTVPGYYPALQPYWGKNRLMMAGCDSINHNLPFVSFSADTASVFYKGAAELVKLYDTLTPKQDRIARYWDDGPGYSGTPAGHLFTLAMQLSRQQRLTLPEQLNMFALLGIALNDAMIVCWKGKYQYNLIRPVSYIQQYLQPHFNSILPTPPFPEFPSGHSYQSGAAAEVLSSFFGNKFSFNDSTHINRSDIDGTPRHFKSFSDMAAEISLSRFYGGIHFKKTLDISLDYGKKTGLHCIKTLQFRL